MRDGRTCMHEVEGDEGLMNQGDHYACMGTCINILAHHAFCLITLLAALPSRLYYIPGPVVQGHAPHVSVGVDDALPESLRGGDHIHIIAIIRSYERLSPRPFDRTGNEFEFSGESPLSGIVMFRLVR